MSSEEQNLPATWAWATFGDICKVQGGYAFKSADYQETGVLLVRISNLVEGSVEAALNSVFLPKEYLEKFSEYCLCDGDVLIAMSGATTGKMATYRLAIPALLNQRVGRFTIIDSSITEAGYISKLVSSITQQVLQQAYGGAQPNISPSEIEQFIIPLPPLNEQHRIVAKVEALKARSQQVKEALEAIPPLLEQFRQSVLAAAFRGDLTADWREKNPDVEPASELLKKIQSENPEIKQSKINYVIPALFNLPNTWKWTKLSSICSSITDGDHQPPPKVEKGIPFLVISNISKGKLDFSETRYVPEDYYQSIHKKRKPCKGDILYTVVGATYGIPVLVDSEEKFCFQRHIALLRTSHLISNQWLFYILKSDLVYRQATEATTGTAQPTVPLSGLRQIKVPLPPLTEQFEIARRVETLFKIADSVKQQHKQAKAYLDQLDQSILAKAFRGELVPQDPNDEPASILLERIHAERANREAEAKAAKKSTGKTNERRSRKAQQQDSDSVQLGLPGLE